MKSINSEIKIPTVWKSESQLKDWRAEWVQVKSSSVSWMLAWNTSHQEEVDSDEFWNVFVFVVCTLSICSFIQSTLAECLLSARLCSGWRGYSSEQNWPGPHFQGAYILAVGSQTTRESMSKRWNVLDGGEGNGEKRSRKGGWGVWGWGQLTCK